MRRALAGVLALAGAVLFGPVPAAPAHSAGCLRTVAIQPESSASERAGAPWQRMSYRTTNVRNPM
jgi:hypothetical protein